MKASMADVQHALKGIDFPKNKNEIVSYAQSQNASQDIVGRYAQSQNASQDIVADLQELPDRTYTNAADVAQEFSGKHLK